MSWLTEFFLITIKTIVTYKDVLEKKNRKNCSTLQIRVIEVKNGTTISFHQENLLDGDQRIEMKEVRDAVLNEIRSSLQE
jgi:hypothetical protein